MVDRDDLSRINALNGEKNLITQALDNFDDPDGHIDELVIGPEPVNISTVGWTYPPQMVDAIKANLNQRLEEIRQELTNLGITGMEGAQPAAARAAAPPPPRGRSGR